MKLLVINALSALRGGGQTYLINFLKYLPEGGYRIILLVNSRNRVVFEKYKSDKIEFFEVDWASKSIIHRTLWELFALPGFLKKKKAEVYYAPGGIMLTKMPAGIQSATALRNMLPFDKRERQRFRLISYIRFKLWLLRYIFLLSYKMADKVVFISEYSRATVQKYIPGIEYKSVLIPHGLNRFFLQAQDSYPLPEPLKRGHFYLYVSILDVYKAQKEIIAAWKVLIKQGFEYPLVLAGPKYNDYGEAIISIISEPELKDKIIYLGKIDYEKLPGLYKASRALIFASSCECCPNILLEKLAAEKPVFCSNIEPMPEFGGDAVIYFDPYKPETLVREVISMEKHPKEMAEMAKKAGERALKFDWQISVQKTVSFLLDYK